VGRGGLSVCSDATVEFPDRFACFSASTAPLVNGEASPEDPARAISASRWMAGMGDRRLRVAV
jgi:hypothetical protein